MPDINYWLDRKYAILDQNAAATSQNAASNAIAATAAAGVDNTKAKLMPAESAASIAQTRAQANLLGTQARLLPAESAANIGLVRANTGLAQANTGLVGANTSTVARALKTYDATDADAESVTRSRLGLGGDSATYLSELDKILNRRRAEQRTLSDMVR